MTELLDIVSAVRAETEAAVDHILTAAMQGLQDLSALPGDQAETAARLEASLLGILEACAFQDLIGQRLTRLETLVAPSPAATVADPLLNGPASNGQGLNQAAADRLLSAG